MPNKTNIILDQMLEPYIEALLSKKAIAPVVLDVRGKSAVTDAILVCSGRSSRQVSAIAEAVRRHLKKGYKIRPLGVEGEEEGLWVLMDYGDVLIHIFYQPIREFYDIEGLWTDARKVKTPVLETYVSAEREAIDEEA